MKISIKELKRMIVEVLEEDDRAGLKLGKKRSSDQKSPRELNMKSSSDGDDNWNDSLDTSSDSEGLKKRQDETCECSMYEDDMSSSDHMNLKPSDSRRRPTKVMQPGEVGMEDTFSNSGLKRKHSAEDWYEDPISSKPVDRLSLDNQEKDRFHNMKEEEMVEWEDEEMDESELDEMGNRKGFDFADCVRSLRGQSMTPEEDCRKKQKRAMGTSRGR